MLTRRLFLVGGLCSLIAACSSTAQSPEAGAAARAVDTARPATIRLYSAAKGGYIMSTRVTKTDADWRKQLTHEQYHVTREQGTERPFANAYWNNHEHGIFRCVCCGNDLYRSEHKFESGTGWPSFWQPIAPENITTHDDFSFFSRRTEVRCARCDAHLGHVFDDGPKPTGLRYCMNSAAMTFVKE